MNMLKVKLLTKEDTYIKSFLSKELVRKRLFITLTTIDNKKFTMFYSTLMKSRNADNERST